MLSSCISSQGKQTLYPLVEEASSVGILSSAIWLITQQTMDSVYSPADESIDNYELDFISMIYQLNYLLKKPFQPQTSSSYNAFLEHKTRGYNQTPFVPNIVRNIPTLGMITRGKVDF